MFVGDAVSSSGISPTEYAKQPYHILLESLDDYRKSIKKMIGIGSRILYPGHGDMILDGLQAFDAALECQRDLQTMIVREIETRGGSPVTTGELIDLVARNGTDTDKLVLQGTVKMHLLELEKRGLLVRQHMTKDETAGVNEEMRKMKGPGGLTMDQIFGKVQESRRKDWNDVSAAVGKDGKGTDKQGVRFQQREKMHPAHLKIDLNLDISWVAVRSGR
ncbi:hypothetical protein HDU76_008140 [Blyttiomyces sp. JEL0837]|nr:hypothetical protein HDU76_008140 [Blyttiomyces sp. JEL0837]